MVYGNAELYSLQWGALSSCNYTNRLRKIIAQFCTGSHCLHMETGRHMKLEEGDTGKTRPACESKLSDPGRVRQLPAIPQGLSPPPLPAKRRQGAAPSIFADL